MTLKRKALRNPQQPPEGAMIEERRIALGLSLTAMARKIGNSRVWWRTLERGLRSDGRPFRASALTYARALLVVGYTPEEIERRAERDEYTEAEQLRLLLIAQDVRRLRSLTEQLSAELRLPKVGMTVDRVCIHLEALRDLCGQETLKTALRRLGWATGPPGEPTEVHAS